METGKSGVTVLDGKIRRCRKTPFPGAFSYVSYRNKKPHYYYTNYDAVNYQYDYKRLFVLLIYSIFIFAGVALIREGLKSVKVPTGYDATIVIEDNLGVIDNEDELRDTFREFYEVNGVTPSVLTVSYDDWKAVRTDYDDGSYVIMNYDSVGSYAYTRSEELFPDGCHLLIVYTEDTDSSGEEWDITFIPGYYTENALNDRITLKAVKAIKRGIADHNGVGETINEVFRDNMHKFKSKISDGQKFLSGIGMLAFILFHGYFFMDLHPFRERMLKKATRIRGDKEIVEDTCGSCGGIYVRGAHTTCPHCEAYIGSDTYMLKDSAEDNVIRIRL